MANLQTTIVSGALTVTGSASLRATSVSGALTVTGSSDGLLKFSNSKDAIIIGAGGLLTGLSNVGSSTVNIGVNAGYLATGALRSNFLGNSAGYSATNATYSNFLGYQAGYQVNGATANNNNFLGQSAGSEATNVQYGNFLGYWAGLSATNATYSNFLGDQAGVSSTNASNSNFLGSFAGRDAANASNSNFLGQYAGWPATNASNSNFLGNQAGFSATNASYSNFLGYQAGYEVSGATANNNNFLGYQAGYQATKAQYSNFFGYQAGANLTGTSDNIAIGRGAAYRATSFSVTSGIFIGGNCTTNGTAVTNVIGLGNNITLTTSNTVVIGNSSQNIGIGTTSPSEKLSISGDTGSYTALKISNGAAGGRSYGFASTNNTNGNGGGKFGIYDFTSGAYRMMIDSTGNVGIGTTAPNRLLTVAGAAGLGLGSELLTNNTFTSNITPWSSASFGGGTTSGGSWNAGGWADFAWTVGGTNEQIRANEVAIGNASVGDIYMLSFRAKASSNGMQFASISLAQGASPYGANIAASNLALTTAFQQFNYPIVISNAGNPSVQLIFFVQTNTTGTWSLDDVYLKKVGNLYASADGNVGIGTVTPTAPLDVVGKIRSSGSAGGVEFSDRTSALGWQWYGQSSTARLWNGTSDLFAITSAGNVGIGTTTPQNKLDIASTGFGLHIGATLPLNGWNGLSIGYSDGTTNNYRKGGLAFIRTDTDYGRGDVYILNDNAGDLNSVTITDVHTTFQRGGNVGIGTTSPGAQLQVNSSAAGTIGEIIKGAASQSADLLQAQNSISSVLAQITSDGTIKSSVGVYVGNDQLSSVLQNQMFS